MEDVETILRLLVPLLLDLFVFSAFVVDLVDSALALAGRPGGSSRREIEAWASRRERQCGGG